MILALVVEWFTRYDDPTRHLAEWWAKGDFGAHFVWTFYPFRDHATIELAVPTIVNVAWS